jgi:Asp-tRNA(Asn)/Glu-tRNA(Gln) amidotransferase B subunit
MGLLNAAAKDIESSPISAAHLGELVALINKGELSGKLAKEILPKMFETGDAASVIMEREGLKQISDTGALEKIADDVIARIRNRWSSTKAARLLSWASGWPSDESEPGAGEPGRGE